MTDNIDFIKTLLNFNDPYDFYYLQILVRKKDQLIKDNHQSVRTIKTYCISNIEYLDKKCDEIKQLCKLFNARAYINLNKYNHKKIGLKMMKILASQLASNQYNHQFLFDQALGEYKSPDRMWVVDIDNNDIEFDKEIQKFINNCKPYGSKVIANVPTQQGHHLITKKFDYVEFKKQYPDIDIHKNNPTILYIP